MKYKIEKNGTAVTITEISSGIGLCFTEGESMQRYTASLFLPKMRRRMGRLYDWWLGKLREVK